jgi:hypothetical protein
VVAWQWKEGPTQGFDIVTYTGTGANRTIAHNLGVAPSMIITKTRSTSLGNWGVYHRSLGATQAINLNLTVAAFTSALWWNNTAPTSSVFTLGTSNDVNGASTYVAYLFSVVAGFSRFGSYTGNGSTDGPMIFTGFRPAFVMIKRSDSTGNWVIQDSSRSPYNAAAETLSANASAAEGSTGNEIDILSNGFKIRNSGGDRNTNGGTYIFAAFASSPFKNSLAR